MAESPKAFAINSVEGVAVHIDDTSEDEHFNVTVVKDGAPVEEHKGQSAETIGDVTSEYFTVEHVDPPTPEEDPEEGPGEGEG